MKFELHDLEGHDVLGGPVGKDNVYIKTYGSIVSGHKKPVDLAVDECTRAEYRLSGQKPTVYVIVRVE